MINISYKEPKTGLYYSQLLLEFSKNKNFKIVDDNHAEFIVMGPGFLCDEALKITENLNVKKFKTCLFLNKEYKNLERKLSFIRKNEIDYVFTVHHDYNLWGSACPKSKFYKIPFGFNPNIFKNYKLDKTIDIGFTGNLFNKGIYRHTDIMGKNFNNVRERIFQVLKKDSMKNYKMFLGDGLYLNGEEYGKKISSSKIWICTPSAIDIVGPRFYEIMGSNTLLFCKNLPNVYNGLFEENTHYVGFNDDLSDFEKKIIFYLKNDSERVKIAEQGYNLALQNHTWKNRVDTIYEILKGEKNG